MAKQTPQQTETVKTDDATKASAVEAKAEEKAAENANGGMNLEAPKEVASTAAPAKAEPQTVASVAEGTSSAGDPFLKPQLTSALSLGPIARQEVRHGGRTYGPGEVLPSDLDGETLIRLRRLGAI